jgi:hypothetical protein
MAKEELIGSKNRDLVLRTAGRVSVLIGDKYYSLNFGEESTSSSKDDDTNNSNSVNSVISTESIDGYLNNDIQYPGDNKMIVLSNGDVYVTLNGEYKKLFSPTGAQNINSFNNVISFLANPGFRMQYQTLIANLNANFLNGKRDVDFVQNSNNIKLRNLVVDSISSSDGKFYYKNGVFSMNNTENTETNKEYISDKISIGPGITITKIEELESFKYIPYDNTVVNDLFSIEGDFNYSDISQLISFANSTNTIDTSSYTADEVIDLYNKLSNYIYFKLNDSSLWDKYQDIKNKYCDIDSLPFNKSCYKLYITSSDGISIYDQFDAVVKYVEYEKDGVITDNTCEIDDTYTKKEVSTNIKCCVTQIGDGYICVTTNFESNLYKYGSESTYSENISTNNYNNVITFKTYDYGENYDCYTDKSININNICFKNNYIGDINGLTYLNNTLDGYGIYIVEDCYLINPKIHNEFRIIDNSSEQTIDVTLYKYFSLLDSGNVLFSGELINGLEVNIYANKQCSVYTGDATFILQSNTYNTFRCVPISQSELK